MGWPKSPLRHGLSGRGVKSFAYKPNFVSYSLPPRSEEMRLNAVINLHDLMLTPTKIEQEHDSIALYLNLADMNRFDKTFGEKLREDDIQPDFLLDAAPRASPLLYFVTNGSRKLFEVNDSLRASVVVYMLTVMDDPKFWSNNDYVYFNVLTPDEKIVLLPKMLRRVAALDPGNRGTILKDLYILSVAGMSVEDKNVFLKTLNKAVSEQKQNIANSLSLDTMADAVRKMDTQDMKVFYYMTKNGKLGWSLLPDTDDLEHFLYLVEQTGTNLLEEIKYGQIHYNSSELPSFFQSQEYEELLEDLAI